ncbi:hypothetical protein WMF30_42050 [Sorangium sp. So ce134]
MNQGRTGREVSEGERQVSAPHAARDGPVLQGRGHRKGGSWVEDNDVGTSPSWPLAATGHLGCVVPGALHVDLQRAGRLGRVVAYYCALSGAGSGYDYFAPSVGALPWARFQATDASGPRARRADAGRAARAARRPAAPLHRVPG